MSETETYIKYEDHLTEIDTLQAKVKEQAELITGLKQGAVDLVKALHAYGSNGDEYNTALRDMGKLLAKGEQ